MGATLADRPRLRVQWNRAILLAESHKLDPWPLDEGGAKTKKWQIKAQSTMAPFWRGKKELKKESSWFEDNNIYNPPPPIRVVTHYYYYYFIVFPVKFSLFFDKEIEKILILKIWIFFLV